MPSTINLQNVQIKNGSTWYTMCPFPVGYIYMGYTSTSPANVYGGTWSSISGGRYFRAAAANNAAGSNTIATENMPSHTHNLGRYVWARTITNTDWDTSVGFVVGYGGTSSDPVCTKSTNSTGGGSAFYPTYQNVYAWRRTA